MRKNRKMPQKLSVVTVHFMHMGGVLAMLFVVVIINLLAMSRCTHLENSIGEKGKALRRLEEEYDREDAQWQRMKSPEMLKNALRSHGLSMDYPETSQQVHMDADGKPLPHQFSLAKAEARARAAATATASVTVKRRRSASARRR